MPLSQEKLQVRKLLILIYDYMLTYCSHSQNGFEKKTLYIKPVKNKTDVALKILISASENTKRFVLNKCNVG